jgi:hypothetical protein
MGVDLNGAQLLLRARQNGVSFLRLATLGRQGLHANRPALISILRKKGIAVSPDTEKRILDPTNVYSEAFFELLGAREITAIDASSYEGAQIVHDMNLPIPGRLASSFDAVFDGGTLEHVFNFPVAICNAMQLTVLGGRLLSISVANNFSGHGFYQFSPELFYRLFSKNNGYAAETCILWEETQGSKFYQVPDPDSTRSRIELTSQSGTFMFFQALRTGEVAYGYIPQQSDYAVRWAERDDLTPKTESRSFGSKLREIPIVRFLARTYKAKKQSKPLRSLYAEAEYRRRKMARNSKHLMSPIEDMKVEL